MSGLKTLRPFTRRLYLLWRLQPFNVYNKMLQMFYQSVVSSAIFCSMVFWVYYLKAGDAKRMDKLVRKAALS